MCRPTPFFSSRIAASAALDHGVYGSVCFTRIPASRHLRRNVPMTCSFAPSIIIVFGAPSRWRSSDSPSWACDFLAMGKALHQPSGVANICAHLLLRLEVVLENNVSVKQSIGSRRYRNCLSFVRKRRDRVGCSTVRMPRWVVASIVLAAVLKLIPQLVARTCGVSCGPADAEWMIETFARIVLQRAASSCMVEICFRASCTRSGWGASKEVLETRHRRLGGNAPIRSPVSNTALARASSCRAIETSCGSYWGSSLVRTRWGSDSYSSTVGFAPCGERRGHTV